MTRISETTDRVLQRCRELGFALAGVCDASPTDHQCEVRSWLAAGQHGEMEYLSRNLELRIDPAKFVPGAKSIICVADRYEGLSSSSGEANSPGLGRIARYARGKDYHKVMRNRLARLCRELNTEHPEERFRACVDTAPVFEREHAQRAGVGAIGKNTMILQRGVGSWLLLGEIVTTLPLARSRSSDPDPCGECTRCIDACPTHAIAEAGWRVDSNRCISYLTIEHRSLVDPQFHERMGDWLFGCDICQEVCPHNQVKSANADAATHTAYQPRFKGLDLVTVLNWTEEDRARTLASSAMKRARLDMLKRNAIIALGNAARSGAADVSVRNRISQIAEDHAEAPLVRDTAKAVIARMNTSI